jgi:hypothetical protein
MSERVASRIVVALDPAGGEDMAIEIAALVSNDPLEVVGLFVEDVRLLEHASSPLAREIAFPGRERSLDRRALERQIRAQAAEVRRRFEAAAGRLGLRPVFQIARGEVLAEISREAVDADILVVSFGAATRLRSAWGPPLEQLVRSRPRALLFARENRPANGILVVLEAGTAAVAALNTAVRLARRSYAPLRVFATAAVLTCLDVGSILRAEGVDAPALESVETIDTGMIERAARDALLVILSSRDTTSDEALIGELLANLRAPIMLVTR